MNELTYHFSVSPILVSRFFLAFLWGIGWAVFLNYHRIGQNILAGKTWFAVAVGVGVDLLIAYNADWWTITMVMFVSSIGIVWRRLNEESQVNYNKNHVKWGIMDATAIADDLITELSNVLKEFDPHTLPDKISHLLYLAHSQREILRAARKGEMVQK